MNKANRIAPRLRQAREQASLEPAALRARLRKLGIDVSKTGLHRLETTEPSNPNLKLITAIAKITNVSPAWLLFGEGPSLPADGVQAAVRERVLDTMSLMAKALDLSPAQQKSLDRWIAGVRKNG